jgi:hypothetical protein
VARAPSPRDAGGLREHTQGGDDTLIGASGTGDNWLEGDAGAMGDRSKGSKDILIEAPERVLPPVREFLMRHR